MPQFARADGDDQPAEWQGCDDRLHRCRVQCRRDATGVADTIPAALDYVPPERLFPSTNCGTAPMASEIAYAKLAALAAVAELARRAV
jgi:methionine synthase II (cobalamin-independent)